MGEVRAQRALRCPKCCRTYDYRRSYRGKIEPVSPARGWGGYEFTEDPPKVRMLHRGDGRHISVEIRCRDCGHVWSTVDFGACDRAAKAHGFENAYEMRCVRED